MVKQAGFDLVWFGIFVVLIVEMAEVSPPVGFNLFVLQTMSGKDSNTVARAALPFFFLLVAAVAIITVFPDIVMVLPRMAFPTSDSTIRPTRVIQLMISFCKSLALAAAVALAAGAAHAQTKWNLPAAYPADNPHSENLVAFAKDVEAATGGKLQITVHPGASLFKAPEIKRAVQTGQAQMGEVLLSIHENEDRAVRHRRGAVPRGQLPGGDEALQGLEGRRSRRSSPRRASCCCWRCRGRRRASTPRRTSTRSRT